MTFEHYWHERTVRESDIIHNLWVADIGSLEGHYALGNQLYHLLKQFAKEIWEEAQKNNT